MPGQLVDYGKVCFRLLQLLELLQCIEVAVIVGAAVIVEVTAIAG
jgi:hypothetical protein